MRSLSIVISDEDILGGVPVFAGTRVPVQTLIDYLKGGHPLDEFLDHFPTIQRSQVQGVISLLGQLLAEQIELNAA